MDKDLSHAYPPLATKALLIKADYEAAHPGVELRVIGVWRSAAEQEALYAKGRTAPGPIVTARDGVHKKSNHQGDDPKGNPCSMAIDFGAFINGVYQKDDKYYKPLRDLAHKYQLKSGWDFPDLVRGAKADPPHVEWDSKLLPIDWTYLDVPPTSDSTAV